MSDGPEPRVDHLPAPHERLDLPHTKEPLSLLRTIVHRQVDRRVVVDQVAGEPQGDVSIPPRRPKSEDGNVQGDLMLPHRLTHRRLSLRHARQPLLLLLSLRRRRPTPIARQAQLLSKPSRPAPGSNIKRPTDAAHAENPSSDRRRRGRRRVLRSPFGGGFERALDRFARDKLRVLKLDDDIRSGGVLVLLRDGESSTAHELDGEVALDADVWRARAGRVGRGGGRSARREEARLGRCRARVRLRGGEGRGLCEREGRDVWRGR